MSDPRGHNILAVEAGFDEVWEYMGDVVQNLGFKVGDRNRSKQVYDISRQLTKTRLEEKELRDTGVERTVGTQEQYQIYIDRVSDNASGQGKKQSSILVRNSKGQPDTSSLARHLLVQIKAYLEQPIQ